MNWNNLHRHTALPLSVSLDLSTKREKNGFGASLYIFVDNNINSLLKMGTENGNLDMKLRCHCLLKEASCWCGPSGTVPAKSSHSEILCDLTGQQQKQIFLQVPGYSGDEKHTGTGPGNKFRKRIWWLSVPQPPPLLFKAEPFGGCSSPCPGCGATSA